MQIYKINNDDIIMICSKKTLENNNDFFDNMSKNKAIIDFSNDNYCSGVLCYEEKTQVIKLLKKSPKKLYSQLKNGNMFLR